jgi:hypothetical protein
MKMKHWYVVRESHSPSLREGDIIGFGKQNPNLTTIQDGRFVPSADWIYIGRWDVPPVDDLIEAIKLIQAKDARIKELDGMLDARSKEIVGRIQECQACQIDQLRAEGKIGISEAPGRQEEAELSTSREVKRLEARNEALLKIGRKPLEDCHRIQQTLRDRLDRIHGYLFDHNAPWKNGDGTDDIAIAYMNRQATRIHELEDAHKRSGVKYAKIINELRSSVYANVPGLKKQSGEIEELKDDLETAKASHRFDREEIERLRTENRELLHEIKDLSRIIDTGYKQLVCDRTGLNERQDLPEGIRRMAASVQELEAQLALTTSALENATRKPDVIDATGTGNLDFSDTNVVDDLIKNGNSLRARAQKAETRIKELEGALVEERAKRKIGPDAALKKQWDDVLGTTRRSWQITEERREALKQAAHTCYEVTAFDIAKVLRAMLEEVSSNV